MARLIFEPGPGTTHELQLAAGSTLIGRGMHRALLQCKNLSRRHARIDLDGEKAEIRDLASKNGTFVDGVRIELCRLRGGEEIRCGDAVFRFEPDAETAPEPLSVLDLDADLTRRRMTDLLGASGRTALRLRSTAAAERAQEKLQVLLKVSQLLSSPETIDRQLEKILDLVFEILDVDRAVILAVDEATAELRERAVKTRAEVGHAGRFYSRHITEYVRKHGVAALFADVRSDPDLAVARSVVAQSICSSMCAPLKPKERLLGVLYVDNLTLPDRFSDEDLEFLCAFASQAAIAVENALLYEQLEQEAVRRNNLLRFFPPKTADRILGQSGPPLDEVIDTEVTALFCDISGFTAISAQMAPAEVVALLNDYFPRVAEIVFRHEGTLEKYIGDALLAVWGAPFRKPDDALRAVRAAVDMQRAMREWTARAPHRPSFEIHIGLNTGHVAAGNIGSERYMQYATIGDTTNLASRICDAAGAGEILLAASTLERLRPLEWRTEELARVRLKGVDEPQPLFRLDWRRSGPTDA